MIQTMTKINKQYRSEQDLSDKIIEEDKNFGTSRCNGRERKKEGHNVFLCIYEGNEGCDRLVFSKGNKCCEPHPRGYPNQ